MHGLHVEILHEMSAVEVEWRALADEGTSTAYQTYEWVGAAYETFERGNNPVIIYASRNNEPAFVIPLLLEKGFPSVLRWPGNNHANICCGIYSREFLNSYPNGLIADLFQFITAAFPVTILLHLKNQPATLEGYPNPMLEMPHQTGPNPLFTIDLTSGFDAVLDIGNGKRKRKLFRRQCRIADVLGGYELVIPKTQNEIDVILDEFFRLKAARLKILGISDVFAPKKAKDFLIRLANHKQQNGHQALRFFVLKVGGKMRALYGASIVDKRCYSFINAVEYHEFSEESPGEMVLYLMIEHLANSGFEYFDIGIGHERYKNSWCKHPTPLHETIHPLATAAGPHALCIRLLTRIKERIKTNQTVWNRIKQIRRMRAKLFS